MHHHVSSCATMHRHVSSCTIMDHRHVSPCIINVHHVSSCIIMYHRAPSGRATMCLTDITHLTKVGRQCAWPILPSCITMPPSHIPTGRATMCLTDITHLTKVGLVSTDRFLSLSLSLYIYIYTYTISTFSTIAQSPNDAKSDSTAIRFNYRTSIRYASGTHIHG